jgi:hypothetical protein
MIIFISTPSRKSVIPVQSLTTRDGGNAECFLETCMEVVRDRQQQFDGYAGTVRAMNMMKAALAGAATCWRSPPARCERQYRHRRSRSRSRPGFRRMSLSVAAPDADPRTGRYYPERFHGAERL